MKNKKISSILLICTLVVSSNALASIQDSSRYWIEQSRIHKLSESRMWQQLMHYETDYLSSLESEVTSDSFFISPLGRKSPKHELEATIKAMLSDEQEDNVSAQCRFPARKQWLSIALPGIAQQMPATKCSKYQQYVSDYSANSISLLYASGYLGNPASMYGHLLIKLNNNNNNELLENTLNYGAMVPTDENKLKYITLGIFGGYQAKFSTDPFHRHSQIYNESELRNLWEYKLDLNQAEIDLVLAHHWELQNNSFTYYFFKQNCAYQIAKLLELVINKPLMNPNKPWVMPYDVIAAIAEPIHGSKPTVKTVRRHNSRQEALYDKFHQLTTTEQKIVRNIASENNLQVTAFLNLHQNSKKRVIETLFDYYSFLEITQAGLSAEQKAIRQSLLAERFKLSTEQINWISSPAAPPHEAQYPSLFQLSPTYNSVNGEGLELRYRANYYDLLALDAGRLPFSELSMFDLRLLYRNNRLNLKSWDLFHVQNLNVSNTGLPYDGGNSWSVRVGVSNIDLSCDDCLVGRVSGSFGKSYRMNSNSAIFGMLDGKVQAPDRNKGHIKMGIKAGVISKLAPTWRTSLNVGYHYYLDNNEQHGHTIEWENRFGQAKDWDIRANFHYDGASEIGLSYSYYW